MFFKPLFTLSKRVVENSKLLLNFSFKFWFILGYGWLDLITTGVTVAATLPLPFPFFFGLNAVAKSSHVN